MNAKLSLAIAVAMLKRPSWTPIFMSSLLLAGGGPAAVADVPVGRFVDPKPVAGLASSNEDSGVYLSPDELTIYFHSNEVIGGKKHIWMATRASRTAPFGEAEKLPSPINLEGVSSRYPYLSPDGSDLYFASTGQLGGRGGVDIWVSARDTMADAWGEPVKLGANINTSENEWAPELSTDQLTIYFRKRDLYVATRSSVDDQFGPALPLDNINTRADEGSPSISTDGLTLFYFRHDFDAGVPVDLWVSTRPSLDEPFSNPMKLDDFSLGSNINSFAGDFEPHISRDWPALGSKLYFSVFIAEGDWDIYEATWVPEPTSILLLLPAALAMCWRRR